jgi:hypothetical protein
LTLLELTLLELALPEFVLSEFVRASLEMSRHYFFLLGQA